jgi:adenylate kinase
MKTSSGKDHVQIKMPENVKPDEAPRLGGFRPFYLLQCLWEHRQMRKYVIMGVQGSGKGTQAKLLADTFDLVHLIVDGFPRNARQAEFFLESFDIDGVINLHLSDDQVERRILSRRLCEGCGLDYNLIAHRPKVEDTCDVCNGRLVGRDDDTPEALGKRLRDYHSKTKPVIEIFERKEFVVTIDADQAKQDVFEDICSALGLPAAGE